MKEFWIQAKAEVVRERISSDPLFPPLEYVVPALEDEEIVPYFVNLIKRAWPDEADDNDTEGTKCP